MFTKKSILGLADYVMQKSYTVRTPGLDKGKAGLSLVLFEISRRLNNDRFEDRAFDLLQESLLFKKGDISFENGLAGIGYLLCHLIEKGFLEADFDDLFSEQYAEINSGFESVRKNPIPLVNSLNMVYYFNTVHRIKKEEVELISIQTIIEAVELYLSIQFTDFASMYYARSKKSVVDLFEKYLKVIYSCQYKSYSKCLIALYLDLYQQGLIASSYKIGYYLNKMALQDKIIEYKKIADANLKLGLANVVINALSLSEQVEILSLFRKDVKAIAGYEKKIHTAYLENIERNLKSDDFSIANDEYEKVELKMAHFLALLESEAILLL